MEQYLKQFTTHSQYESYIATDYAKPNVSYCVQQNEVHYNPWVRDYSKEYFTTIALENGTISFDYWYSVNTDKARYMEYSTDNGETWTRINNIDDETVSTAINVSEGDNIMWRGDNDILGYNDYDDWEGLVGSFFSSTCEFNATGNIMSLLYGSNFENQTEIEEDYVFANLFYDAYQDKECNILNASNLILPATTLTQGCYENMFFGCASLTTAPALLPATTLTESCYSDMFNGCTSLVIAPELPATTLAEYCYYSMFQTCTSLTTAPELPATTLVNECYEHMFYDCRSLEEAPALPATTLASACYAGMFYNCRSLEEAPALPATTLVDHCYGSMFYGCISLTEAPTLSATTLAKRCYANMFKGCRSLTTAPVLSVTTLAEGCYYGMFETCTSLTAAPILPAITLVKDCYNSMFRGCTLLNYIKAMFTTTPSGSSPNYYTNFWVDMIAPTGTFVKNAAASWNVTGVHGIPNGWTVETASA